jgi:hypothetical protein
MSGGEHCGVCHYQSFYGVKSWCFHPEHPLEIKKRGKRCGNFEDDEAKRSPKVVKLTLDELPGAYEEYLRRVGDE